MNKYETAVNNAVSRLKTEHAIDVCDIKHIENRYFSIIYEMNDNIRSYILKISTTDRTCENEYNMYKYMSEIEILSLTPILYSKQYNYLVTIKLKLIDLPSKLKLINNYDAYADYMIKLGKVLKELENKTGINSVFNKKQFDDYIMPRISKMSCIDSKSKLILSDKLDELTTLCDGSPRITSMATDVNLGNLHLNESGEYVLLDMGDSHIDDCYANIVGVYLALKYGSLNQYIENNKKTEALFSSFMRGYDLKKLDKLVFNVYQIKSLICMVLFIESLNTNNRNIIKSLLSSLSNRYLIGKYMRYMHKLLEETYE